MYTLIYVLQWTNELWRFSNEAKYMKAEGDDRIYRKIFIRLGIFKLCAGIARDVEAILPDQSKRALHH